MKHKYPRTLHLDWSQKLSSDDKQHKNDNHFLGKNVVVTIKMDGENTTIYNNSSHARSMDSQIDSEDRRWIETLRILKISGNIPNNWRICGENMFWKHTCFYNDLESMFLVFSIWNDENCLSWNDTKKWCQELELKTVPVLYEGLYDKELILKYFSQYVKTHGDVEGFVIRNVNEFNINDFSNNISKYVREGFLIPEQHWRHSKKVENQLINNKSPWSVL